MGAAATLLKQVGLDVEGGDNKFAPPMSDYLKQTQIKLYSLNDIDLEFLKNFDLIVVGNVVPRGSEDAELIESSGVPYCSFPAALGAFVLGEQNVVGIAGTHGKTTTTYLAAQVFEKLGHRPGYFIGGVISDRPSALLGDGSYFFIEADEYDSSYFEKISKFRLYEINHLILTSLEFDHGDIFDSLADIQAQFGPLLKSLTGNLIYDDSYTGTRECLVNYPPDKAKTLRPYALETDYGPRIIEMGAQGTRFEMSYGGKSEVFQTNLIGRHNILNLCSILSFCDLENKEIDKVKRAVEMLSLVKRRQEVKGYFGESLVIDDFAHHPKAVMLTLEGLKTQYSNKKLTVVFEPHSATARSDYFQNEFEKSLALADSIILTKLHRPTSLKNTGDLNLNLLKTNLERLGKSCEIVSDLGELELALRGHSSKDDVIVVLSNGTCLGLWESSLVGQ